MIRIKKIKNLSHSYKHFRRYREIIHVLIKYGFGNKLKEPGLSIFRHKSRIPVLNTENQELKDLPKPVKVRMAMAELGPTFIKLGQILATRPDLIPPEYSTEFYKLQDDAPHFTYDNVEKIFMEETGKKPEEIFDSFDKTPLAAASIGQVHRAVYNNESVVVKVQRPNIVEKIAADLEIIYHLAQILERHIYEVMLQKPSEIVKEFKKSIEKELDFLVELSQTERFLKDFAGDETIYVPKPYKDISTKRILVLEYIDGIKLHDTQKLKDNDYDFKKIANRGTESLLRQIFVNGYFHADPHPGNIFVLPDNVFCFIDFGMMGKISSREREIFAGFLLNIIKKRGTKIVKSILKFTTYEKEPDLDALQRDLAGIIDECLIHPMTSISFGAFVEGLMEVLSEHYLRVRPNMFLLMKSLASIETVAHSLDPDLEFVKMSAPYIRNIIENRFNKDKMTLNLADSAEEYLKLFYEFPETAHILLKQAKMGNMRFKVSIEQKKIREAINRLSMRMATAIILAALLISHSMILFLPKSKIGHIVKTWGMLGFIISALLGFYLLFSLLRRRS
jgi:ubiquinone biosynthesis protein